jgi:hypothetical protein
VIDVGAIACAWWLAYDRYRAGSGFRPALVGAAALTAGLGAWASLVQPMNQVMATWTPAEIPADFAAVRLRWELGHAAVAAIKLMGFLALAASVLARPEPSGRP